MVKLPYAVRDLAIGAVIKARMAISLIISKNPGATTTATKLVD
jgi:hypothetical protein